MEKNTYIRNFKLVAKGIIDCQYFQLESLALFWKVLSVRENFRFLHVLRVCSLVEEDITQLENDVREEVILELEMGNKSSWNRGIVRLMKGIRVERM